MNIHISNLNVASTDETLKAAFSKYGEVSSAKVMIDGFTGTSRGFAYVVMPNESEAIKAVQEMNGSLIDGSPITVKESKPPVEFKGSYSVGARHSK